MAGRKEAELKRKHLVFLTAALIITLTACAGGKEKPGNLTRQEIDENYEAAKKNLENIYYGTLQDMTGEGGIMADERPMAERMYERFFHFYRALSDLAPYLITISIALGVFVMALARRNKRIQRFAFVYLILLIPVTVTFVVFAGGASALFKRL